MSKTNEQSVSLSLVVSNLIEIIIRDSVETEIKRCADFVRFELRDLDGQLIPNCEWVADAILNRPIDR